MRFAAWVVLVLSAVGAVAGCAPDKRVAKLLGGPEQVAALSAGEVRAWRLDGTFIEDPATHLQKKAVGAAVPLTEEDRDALARVLRNPSSYLFDLAKACEVTPGVAVEYPGEPGLEILFCFECDMLTVIRGGQRLGYEDFDPARRALVAIMKRVFPADPVIQALE